MRVSVHDQNATLRLITGDPRRLRLIKPRKNPKVGRKKKTNSKGGRENKENKDKFLTKAG